MKAIPKILFPVDLDNDYTLFEAHNSAQTILVRDLSSEGDVIEISARAANDSEMLAENGFVTIEQELIYYDSVVKNSSGKICQLKNCIRGVEGVKSNYLAGTNVSANVIAQHHNQLVDAVLAIENTIGDISEMLKLGAASKSKKSLIKPDLVAEVNHGFSASLHTALTSMLSAPSIQNDVCPDVEFELNMIGSTAEYCVRIFGSYSSFLIDFGDGFTESAQMAGTHQYTGVGPFNATVTVNAPNCTIVQMPNPFDGCCSTSPLPNPAISFVIQIPLVPPFPSFIAPEMICPGPLFNLPPILMPSVILCPSQISTSMICPSFVCPAPSVIISVIEACKTPQIIKVISPCRLSIVSLVGCNLPSVISLVGCCPPSVISVIAPKFDVISFSTPPSFNCISFCAVPSFNLISFSNPPIIPPISFTNFPSMAAVSFDILVDLSVSPICFCTPPSFAPISFAPAPTISVDWGTPPTVSCVVSVKCPASSTPVNPQSFAFANPVGMADVEENTIPVTLGDLGIPEEITLIVPKISDIKLIHDLPKEITVKASIPEEIMLRHDLPRTIEIISDLPRTISLDASSLPRKIIVEPGPNFPSVLEVVGMPKILQVIGIPETIEIKENIPRTIQLLMPEDPTVTMKWDGVPVEMKPSPDFERMLSNIMIQPK